VPAFAMTIVPSVRTAPSMTRYSSDSEAPFATPSSTAGWGARLQVAVPPVERARLSVTGMPALSEDCDA
jgi:hypothetical protein